MTSSSGAHASFDGTTGTKEPLSAVTSHPTDNIVHTSATKESVTKEDSTLSVSDVTRDVHYTSNATTSASNVSFSATSQRTDDGGLGTTKPPEPTPTYSHEVFI